MIGGHWEWILLRVLSLHAVSGLQKRQFISLPSHPSKCPNGGNVSLEWKFQLLPGDEIKEISFGVYDGYLSKKLLAVEPDGKVFVQSYFEKKVSWTGDIQSNIAVVWMYNLTASDENNYGIFIELGLDKTPLTDSVSVMVQEYPRIVNISQNITVQEGDEMLLFCRAEGKPLPRTRLDKVNSSLASKAAASYSDLLIPRVKASTAGWYRCLAENDVGQDEDFFLVNVAAETPLKNVASANKRRSDNHLFQPSTQAAIVGASVCVCIVVLIVFVVKKYRTRLRSYNGNYTQLVA